MAGTRIVIVVAAIALLRCGGSAFNAYLSHRRASRAAELKSEEQRALIECLSFAGAQETERARILADQSAIRPR